MKVDIFEHLASALDTATTLGKSRTNNMSDEERVERGAAGATATATAMTATDQRTIITPVGPQTTTESSAGSSSVASQPKVVARLVEAIKNNTPRLATVGDPRGKPILAAALLENIAALLRLGGDDDPIQHYTKLTLKRQDVIKDALATMSTCGLLKTPACSVVIEKHQLWAIMTHLDIDSSVAEVAASDLATSRLGTGAGPDVGAGYGNRTEDDGRSSWSSANSHSSLSSSMSELQGVVTNMSSEVNTSIGRLGSEMRAELDEMRSSIARLTEVVVSIGHGFDKMKTRVRAKDTTNEEDRRSEKEMANEKATADVSRKRPASKAPESSSDSMQGNAKRKQG